MPIGFLKQLNIHGKITILGRRGGYDLRLTTSNVLIVNKKGSQLTPFNFLIGKKSLIPVRIKISFGFKRRFFLRDGFLHHHSPALKLLTI